MATPEAVSVTAFSGMGNVHATTFNRASPLCRLDRFDIREPSRAEAEYPWMERKPMVPRMASIVITMTSSTSVNHGKRLREKVL